MRPISSGRGWTCSSWNLNAELQNLHLHNLKLQNLQNCKIAFALLPWTTFNMSYAALLHLLLLLLHRNNCKLLYVYVKSFLHNLVCMQHLVYHNIFLKSTLATHCRSKPPEFPHKKINIRHHRTHFFAAALLASYSHPITRYHWDPYKIHHPT